MSQESILRPSKLSLEQQITEISESLSNFPAESNRNNTMPTEITFDPMVYISKMNPYDGSSTAELVRFLDKLNILTNSTREYSLNSQIFLASQIRDKIIGKANEAFLRYSVPNITTDIIRNKLIENFGEKESYLQIKERAKKNKILQYSRLL